MNPYTHAKDRGLVRDPLGRIGVLISWPAEPGRRTRRSSGAQARVELRPGVIVSCDPSTLTFLTAPGQAPEAIREAD